MHPLKNEVETTALLSVKRILVFAITQPRLLLRMRNIVREKLLNLSNTCDRNHFIAKVLVSGDLIVYNQGRTPPISRQ
jgi:hypothetical protein